MHFYENYDVTIEKLRYLKSKVNLEIDPFGEEDWDDMEESIKWYSKGKFTEDPNFKEEIKEYDDFITDDKFRQFLIDNNAYDEFIECAHKSFKNDFKTINVSNRIDDGLYWSQTKSGPSFWKKLDTKWRNICKYI